MSNCDHIGKVLTWGVNLIDGDVKEIPTLWGCTQCNETSETSWPDSGAWAKNSDHKDNDAFCECFGCKVKGLQLNTGDAGRADSMPQKKWDRELSAYRDARAQGIQPAGTTMKAVNEAKAASDKLGVAFNAETMPAAQKITKQTAKVMKETKAI